MNKLLITMLVFALSSCSEHSHDNQSPDTQSHENGAEAHNHDMAHTEHTDDHAHEEGEHDHEHAPETEAFYSEESEPEGSATIEPSSTVEEEQHTHEEGEHDHHH